MPTLAEVLINEAADLGKANTMYQSSPFVAELPSMIQRATSEFMHRDVPLNQTIAKIASENKCTDEQIQRICEESNNQVYMAKYAAFKGQLNRDVKFDLASVPGVKACMNEKTAMEKTASVKGEKGIIIDKNSFSIGADERSSMSKIAADKVTALFEKLSAENQKYANSVTEDMTVIAQTFIEQARLGKDVQPVFAHMCKEAGWSEGMMNMCKDAVSHNISVLQAEDVVSNEFSVDLVNYKTNDDFGVGDYGFRKTASTIDFAPIITRGGDIVSDIDALVKVASHVVDVTSKLVPVQNRLHELEKVFGLRGE